MVNKKTTKNQKDIPTLQIKNRRDIAMDFAEKVVQKFNTLIKAVILFGSSAKDTATAGSDVDIIIIVDNATVKFDEEFTVWYREELGKVISQNPYKSDLHINTIKITTWWEDFMKSDPVVVNVIRYGDVLIDVGGFFNPLKVLLQQGKIMPTPESIYNIVNRVPGHIVRSRLAEMSSIEGCYWAYVECSQALLMAVKILPPSPEHIPELLNEHFVKKGLLKKNFLKDYSDIYDLHKMILYGQIKNLDGRVIDDYQNKAEDYFKKTIKILNEIL
ncbi:MAG: nucleotidyltransferase domain-containing protein [Nanoarchaeota archaeon]